MRFEQDLMRHVVASLEDPLQDLTAARKAIRETTDQAIGAGLLVNQVVPMASLTACVMMSVAEVLVTFDKEPELQHFVEAAVASIEHARNAMDRGLQLQDWDQALRGAVMLELACRGIFAALGLPYELVMQAAVACEDIGETIAEWRAKQDVQRVVAGAAAQAGPAEVVGILNSTEPPAPPECGDAPSPLA